MNQQPNPLTEDEYQHILIRLHSLKLPNLKAVARTLSIGQSGRKADVQDRIRRYLQIGRDANDKARVFAIKQIVQDAAIDPTIITPYETLYRQLASTQVNRTMSNASSVSLSQGSTQLAVKKPWLFFKSNPFFVPKKLVTQNAGYCAKAPEGRGQCRITFSLTEEDYQKLTATKNYKLFLLCGVYDRMKSNSDANVEFPHPLEIHFNNIQIKDNIKGIKNKPGTAKPANLTPHIKPTGLINELRIVYAFTKVDYLIFCYIVEEVSPDRLLQRILANPHITKDFTMREFNQNDQDQDDVQEMSTRLSLKCPLSFGRIKYPFKSIYCNHLACFDGLSFIYLQEQASTWQCPVCYIPVQVKELSISDYAMDILKKTSEEVEQVEIDIDGSWRPIIEEEERPQVKRYKSEAPNAASLDVTHDTQKKKVASSPIIISLDSDDDGDDEIVSIKPQRPIKSNQQAQPTQNSTSQQIPQSPIWHAIEINQHRYQPTAAQSPPNNVASTQRRICNQSVPTQNQVHQPYHQHEHQHEHQKLQTQTQPQHLHGEGHVFHNTLQKNDAQYHQPIQCRNSPKEQAPNVSHRDLLQQNHLHENFHNQQQSPLPTIVPLANNLQGSCCSQQNYHHDLQKKEQYQCRHKYPTETSLQSPQEHVSRSNSYSSPTSYGRPENSYQQNVVAQNVQSASRIIKPDQPSLSTVGTVSIQSSTSLENELQFHRSVPSATPLTVPSLPSIQKSITVSSYNNSSSQSLTASPATFNGKNASTTNVGNANPEIQTTIATSSTIEDLSRTEAQKLQQNPVELLPTDPKTPSFRPPTASQGASSLLPNQNLLNFYDSTSYSQEKNELDQLKRIIQGGDIGSTRKDSFTESPQKSNISVDIEPAHAEATVIKTPVPPPHTVIGSAPSSFLSRVNSAVHLNSKNIQPGEFLSTSSVTTAQLQLKEKLTTHHQKNLKKPNTFQLPVNKGNSDAMSHIRNLKSKLLKSMSNDSTTPELSSNAIYATRPPVVPPANSSSLFVQPPPFPPVKRSDSTGSSAPGSSDVPQTPMANSTSKKPSSTLVKSTHLQLHLQSPILPNAISDTAKTSVLYNPSNFHRSPLKLPKHALPSKPPPTIGPHASSWSSNNLPKPADLSATSQTASQSAKSILSITADPSSLFKGIANIPIITPVLAPGDARKRPSSGNNSAKIYEKQGSITKSLNESNSEDLDDVPLSLRGPAREYDEVPLNQLRNNTKQ